MASPVDTSVKFFRNNFPGAPTLTGAVGGALGVLDACLVDGFGLRAVTSLVVAGGVATVTLPSNANNPNLLRSVIRVDGVTGALTAVNGEQRVTGASTTTLSFATAAADGTASGTITVKTASAGWTKVYAGTNKAVYKSADPAALGMFLRVDDSATINLRVRGYESMSDVDTGTGPFPTLAMMDGSGGYWAKSVQTSGNAEWDLFADWGGFYFCPLAASPSSSTYVGQAAYWFGDLVSYKSPDAYAAMLTYSSAAPSSTASYGSAWNVFPDTANGPRVIPRSYTGLGSSVYAYPMQESGTATDFSGADPTMGVFPPPTDAALRLARITVNEGARTGAAAIPRGHFPGIYHVPQSRLYLSFQRGDTVLATNAALAGRRLAVTFAGADFYAEAGASNGGRGLVDITGPWR